MTQDMLTTVFGWLTFLNFAILGFSTIMIIVLKDWVADIHGRMFDMNPAEVRKAYFTFLANYKIMTLIFCLTPWLALKLA
ncbi:hypothetical protein Q5Y75_18445 [Ruegeria sp. 2205SS24-7]|uniref:DUF6868 family protein n=1 Tax=Ruegeria discodermiae TaxID=3064389 RepID=UPI00274033F3|nr:hypothetical protein [Ruegeria sp. 2205SS24-7]MDP5219204.1 hypothetical protein [Ruegeria sp. 2205SS24-7]